MRIVVQRDAKVSGPRKMYKADGRYYCVSCVPPFIKENGQSLSRVLNTCSKCEIHVFTGSVKGKSKRNRRF
jgi:hypothetical protein